MSQWAVQAHNDNYTQPSPSSKKNKSWNNWAELEQPIEKKVAKHVNDISKICLAYQDLDQKCHDNLFLLHCPDRLQPVSFTKSFPVLAQIFHRKHGLHNTMRFT